MEGLDTTIVWMLGVVAAMVIFGIAAAIGYYKNPQQDESGSQPQPQPQPQPQTQSQSQSQSQD